MSFFTNIYNDYMKHIVETKVQINRQKYLPKIEILTYFHNLTLRLLFFKKGQKFKMSVDFVTKKP